MTEAEALVARLEGERCWSVITAGGDDYSFVLDLGERRRRSLRLANPRLSFVQRTFEGSLGLLVECPWRLEMETGPLAAYLDERAESFLADLNGLLVASVDVDLPAGDLAVTFSVGPTLRCFALEPAGRSQPLELRRMISAP